MEKKFRITVEGKPYIVTVEDITADSGQNFYQDTSAFAQSPPAILTNTATPSAASLVPPSSESIAGPGDEVAPLGGIVQTIHVNIGQVINEGDKLVSLEAMKMVTHVVARKGGTIISIAIKVGDPVDAGQVLLTIG